MADRRMFSKKITSSAKFLMMPLETQALYFHLAQNADDDGIVEGFTIMRMVGASQDNLKILQAKQYIKILNDELVTFVIDWLEHNKLRADRKTDSMYKDLLLENVPDVKLLEAKQRKDRLKLVGTDNGTSHGQTLDGVGEVRLGEVRLGQDKTMIANKNELSSSEKKVINFYNKNIGLIPPTIYQQIESYLEDGIEPEMIIKCLEIAVEQNVPKWSYAKSILEDKFKKNIKTLYDFEASEIQRKQKEAPTEPVEEFVLTDEMLEGSIFDIK